MADNHVLLVKRAGDWAGDWALPSASSVACRFIMGFVLQPLFFHPPTDGTLRDIYGGGFIVWETGKKSATPPEWCFQHPGVDHTEKMDAHQGGEDQEV